MKNHLDIATAVRSLHLQFFHHVWPCSTVMHDWRLKNLQFISKQIFIVTNKIGGMWAVEVLESVGVEEGVKLTQPLDF